MSAYPVVHSQFLDEAPSRGLFGLGRKRRDSAELPRADAHVVWVYRVDGRHVVSHGELEPAHETVVRADWVSLVDLTRDVPVTVDLNIPSAEASDFTVRATFDCTVTDPKQVVRENVDAARAVLAYLRRDSKLGQLALNLRISEVNDLRREATARVRAYTEVRDPGIPGLSVRFARVEVLTPKEVATFEERRRQAEAENRLKRLQAGYDQSGELDDERHSQRLADQRRGGRHSADQEDQEFEHLRKLKQQRHEQRLRAENREFARREAEHAYAALEADPLKALLIAEAEGLIDTKALADRMAADSRDQLEYAREQRRLNREEARATAQLDREDDRAALTWGREQRAKREDAEWSMQLEDKREDRKDARDQRREVREDRAKDLDMKLEVLRELAKRGHLDMINFEVGKLVDDISGTGPAVGKADRDELTGTAAAAPIEAGGDAVPDDEDEDDAPVILSDLGEDDEDDEDDRDPGNDEAGREAGNGR
ncbi:hypothetical protein AB0G04_06455 [Actinoplanes sp. NPDC023801]|uniref:hypothetical protein n=1 Tax=Actinoplanes sp. NPDC023801 TaxID=3154595 RepID=UPI0033F536B4